MDSNLAQPCKKAISSEDSRGSNVGPNNSCVEGSQPAHNVNCEDEKNLDALKTNAMEITMEQQSNDNDGAGIYDGIRLVNSSVGKMEELQTSRHVRVDGLNDKKLKVEEGVKIGRKENSFVRSNGLNDKNLKIAEKGEKVVRKEKENSLVRDNGLNNKIIEMATEWNESRAESNRRMEWKPSRIRT